MPIPWLAVLKIVPWSDVITNAPKVVDGAKKLWNNVSNKPAVQEPPLERQDLSPTPVPASDSQAISLLQARISVLEVASAELHGQMLASTELIETLADQNAQLIKHIEDDRTRIKWLIRAMLAYGGVAVCVLALVMAR